jgi:hypothetical protein
MGSADTEHDGNLCGQLPGLPHPHKLLLVVMMLMEDGQRRWKTGTLS